MYVCVSKSLKGAYILRHESDPEIWATGIFIRNTHSDFRIGIHVFVLCVDPAMCSHIYDFNEYTHDY